jgi:hypothetical protein
MKDAVMSELKLTKTRIQAGVWEGLLQVPDSVEALPEIEVTHLEQPIPGHMLSEDSEHEGQWHLRIAIPQDLLSDGVQTFLIHDKLSGDKLGDFTVITGQPMQDDIRAEMDLLRAELDMLKRAFRRHCLETRDP